MPKLTRINREAEQLRQEIETFEHEKSEHKRWSVLRLIMGYSSIGILFLIVVASGYVIFNHANFTATSVGLATSALLVDALGLVASVYKIVLNPKSTTPLSPVTKSRWRSSGK